MSDGRMASYDIRMVKPPYASAYGYGATETPWTRQTYQEIYGEVPRPTQEWQNTKSQKIADDVTEILKKYEEHRGTVLIFSEFGVPRGKSEITWGDNTDLPAIANTSDPEQYSFYNDIKARLIQNGIPADEVQFMKDFKKDRQTAIDQMNAGRIRVLIGTVINMGVGVNINERLVGIVHADPKWRPDEFEQANGRGIRYGNRLYEEGVIPGMRILMYATKGSTDSWMYAAVQNKDQAIKQMMDPDPSQGAISMDLSDEPSEGEVFAQIKAEVLPNPHAIPMHDAERLIRDLENDKKNFNSRKLRAQREIGSLRSAIDEQRNQSRVFTEIHDGLTTVSDFWKAAEEGREALQKLTLPYGILDSFLATGDLGYYADTYGVKVNVTDTEVKEFTKWKDLKGKEFTNALAEATLKAITNRKGDLLSRRDGHGRVTLLVAKIGRARPYGSEDLPSCSACGSRLVFSTVWPFSKISCSFHLISI